MNMAKRKSTKRTQPSVPYPPAPRQVDLAWACINARGLEPPERYQFLDRVLSGEVVLDPVAVAAEVDAFVGTLRCHPGCRDHARQNGGSAAYKDSPSTGYSNPGRCEVCGDPMGCTPDRDTHEYVEMSQKECRANGLFHGGSCYHVKVCVHCGDVNAVDSSG